MSEPSDASARAYVVPTTLRLRPTPYRALQVDTELAEPVGEIAAELVSLFLLFSRPRTIADAHADALQEWTIELSEFTALVEGWERLGFLFRADAVDLTLSRLTVFRRAVDEFYAAGRPGKSFPLRSSMPSQRPLFYYPGLSSREVHDPAAFPWVEELERSFPAIRAELLALVSAGNEMVSVNQAYTSTGEWAAGHLWLYGEKHDDVCRACPETARIVGHIVESTGSQVGHAMFSALAPHTFIAPHCGYTTTKLRCQLPLVVPPRCRLKVGDHELEPREGKAIVFDDSFLHSAWNDSDQVRYVLLFDFFHPDLTRDEIDYLTQLAEEKGFGKPYQEASKAARKVEWTQTSGSAGGAG